MHEAAHKICHAPLTWLNSRTCTMPTQFRELQIIEELRIILWAFWSRLLIYTIKNVFWRGLSVKHLVLQTVALLHQLSVLNFQPLNCRLSQSCSHLIRMDFTWKCVNLLVQCFVLGHQVFHCKFQPAPFYHMHLTNPKPEDKLNFVSGTQLGKYNVRNWMLTRMQPWQDKQQTITKIENGHDVSGFERRWLPIIIYSTRHASKWGRRECVENLVKVSLELASVIPSPRESGQMQLEVRQVKTVGVCSRLPQLRDTLPQVCPAPSFVQIAWCSMSCEERAATPHC